MQVCSRKRDLAPLIALIPLLLASFSVVGTQALEDSEESPLFESTLRQAQVDMREPLRVSSPLPEDDTWRNPPPATQQPVDTRCPVRETECPEKRTRCPEEETRCPAGATECHPFPTKCPAKRTECPYKKTKCPEQPEHTKCGVTHSPRAPTACRQAPTFCEALTRCPEMETYCPARETECPPAPTECGLRYTKCDVTHHPNAPTACRLEPTICQAETWCPEIPGRCPPDTSDEEEIGVEESRNGRAGSAIEPRAVALLGCYPNPFRNQTRLSFMIPRNTHVTLSVYDLKGSRVVTLVDGPEPAGLHCASLDLPHGTPGAYFCVLRADGEVRTAKVTLLN